MDPKGVNDEDCSANSNEARNSWYHNIISILSIPPFFLINSSSSLINLMYIDQ